MFKKIIFSLFFISLLLVGAITVSAQEAEAPKNAQSKMAEQNGVFMSASGLQIVEPGNLAATIINSVLGLLAIIFLILMLYAGWLWMTAQGNDDQVKKAKDIIVAAIIGLVIVVAAYSITYFVFTSLGKVSSGGSMI